MTQVNIFDAKTNLSSLIRMVETGGEDVVVIARHGHPVVQMTAYEASTSRRLGAAAGERLVADDWDINEGDAEVAALFGMSL